MKKWKTPFLTWEGLIIVRINCFVFLLHQTYISLTYISTNLFIKFDIVRNINSYPKDIPTIFLYWYFIFIIIIIIIIIISDMLDLETSKLYI